MGRAQRIEVVGESSICCSIVVASEMRYGAAKKGSEKLSLHVDAVLSALPVLPLNQSADAIYATVRNELTKAGTPIGPNDLFIAAHALVEDLTLITANVGEFLRVPGLRVEDWERP